MHTKESLGTAHINAEKSKQGGIIMADSVDYTIMLGGILGGDR